MRKAPSERHADPAKKKGLTTLLGCGLLILFIIIAVFADMIAPHDPWERFDPYLPPNTSHWLGTNDLGHDIFSELIHGSRVSLLVGLGAAVLATAIGLCIGLFAGYYKGVTDEILMGGTDVFLMIPRIPLIILLAAFLKPSFWIIALVIGFLWWTSTARVVRSKSLQVSEMNFVLSSKCLGFSDRHIIFSDILPNIIQIVIPKFMLTVAAAMITEASLSFLGLGDPSMKSWGMMINFAFTKGGLINAMWWWFIPPGLCITLFVYSVVLLGYSFEEKEQAAMGAG
ncbi:MAG: ABC transporter permease [Candidatus Aminicenantes bacterium]|jgi:peptide/nickel transport system permease protein